MADSGTPIAVAGAAGQLGRLVVRHLADLGAPMRLLVRDPARAPQVAGAAVVAAEYWHPHALRAALAGVRTAFLVSAHEAADRMDLHSRVGRVAWVAREDIARVAAHVLTTEGHEGQIYDVTGPEATTLAETAEILAEVSGRPVRYEEETVEEARASRSYAEDWEIDGWVGTYVAIATGEVGVTSHAAEVLTGRRPWTLRELLHAEPELIAPLTKDG